MPPSDQNAFVREALERAGWRCTKQRLAVYDHLVRSRSHPTADELYQVVKPEVPHISLATVYKALDALIASGLATKLPTGDGSARYDGRQDDHYHFRDVRSGRVRDLPTSFDPRLLDKLDPQLQAWLQEQGLEVTSYRLELVGYARDSAVVVEDPTESMRSDLDAPQVVSVDPADDAESEHDI